MKTYPLSQSQLGVFLEMIQHPQMTQYNLGYMTSLPKSIDLDRFEQALRTIYANCPAFHKGVANIQAHAVGIRM